MADKITLQVARYRPERETEPTFQEYEVPCPPEWVVLDGLNYVKDHLDGTLSYRWSCRMGICGSCGMMVNGDPKLTCATFLTEYAPGPVRVEPLSNFPVVRDLVVELGDFMRKLTSVKPWIVREEEKPLSEGESLSFYGAILPSLRLYTPNAAEAVLTRRLNLPTLEALLRRRDRYYDLNWVWLGIAADLGWIRHRTPSPAEVVP